MGSVLHQVEYIDMSCNPIFDSIRAFTAALQLLPKLRYVNWSYCGITEGMFHNSFCSFIFIKFIIFVLFFQFILLNYYLFTEFFFSFFLLFFFSFFSIFGVIWYLLINTIYFYVFHFVFYLFGIC